MITIQDSTQTVDCPACGEEMPLGRKEWYNICADCNDEQPYAGMMVYDHKTAVVWNYSTRMYHKNVR